MKKIIKIITIGIAFFIMSKNCYALNIVQGQEIADIKVMLKTSKINDIRKIYEITNLSNNELLYNIELENVNYTNTYESFSFYGGRNPLSENLKEKISLITYFGYGYQNRTDIKWYAITQYLIWEELIKNENGEIHFVDNNGNKVDLYNNEINEIREDIKHYYIIPSFLEDGVLKSEYNLKLTEELTFEDKNNVLNEYIVSTLSSDLKYKVENNKLVITPINPNLINIMFQRKGEELKEYMQIYLNTTSQKLISRGKINPIIKVLTININFPKVKIKSKNIKENISENRYTIYTDDGREFYTDIALDKNGLSEEYIFPRGKYYLVQTKNAYGYKLNDEKIYFEIKNEDITITLENELETKHVTIEKQLIKDNKEVVLGANTTLNIFDSNNKLVKEITTNKDGKAFIELPYGTYKIIERKNQENLEKAVLVTIDENFNEKQIVIIKEEIVNNDNTEQNQDNIKKGNIIVTKYDSLNGKPIQGLKIGLFNKNKELIAEGITDISGKVIFKDIETGFYYIKEIIKEGNNTLEDAIKVEVKENVDTLITSNNRIKIDVPNTKSIDFSILINVILIVIGIYMNKFIKENEKIN